MSTTQVDYYGMLDNQHQTTYLQAAPRTLPEAEHLEAGRRDRNSMK
jgi:hypothetical protein